MEVPPSGGKRTTKKEENANTLKTVLRFLSDAYAMTKPEPLRPLWRISDDEIEALSKAVAESLPSLPKQVVDTFERYKGPINVGVTLAAILGPRLIAEAQINAELAHNPAGTAGNEFRARATAPNGGGPRVENVGPFADDPTAAFASLGPDLDDLFRT